MKPMSIFTRRGFYAILLVAGAVWIWLSAPSPAAITQGQIPAPREGFQAPNMALPSSSGQVVQLSSLRGRVVIVNFWASWCPPCKAEMPALERVYRDYADRGLVVWGVNATDQDNPASASDFVRQEGLTFTILYDQAGEASRLYQLQALPSTYFIDPRGIIRTVVIGGPMSEALLRSKVADLLQGTN
jgi:cytochrome c biogenesis protein CcmG/thiol:disulfide interchange protein DsbE